MAVILAVNRSEVVVFDNEVIKIGWNANENFKQQTVNYSWDEDTTRIIRALLMVEAHTGNDRNSFAIDMNGAELWETGWDIGQGCQLRRQEINVTNRLKNGLNTFTARFWRFHWFPIEVSVRVSARLIVDYEGEEPPPPQRGTSAFLPQLITALTIVGGISGIASLVVSASRRKGE